MERGPLGMLAACVLLAACASDGGSAGTAPPQTTTATSTTSTTTTTTTTTTTEPPAPPPPEIEALGFPVSDEWVVETVVADIDSGTGGLAVDADGVMYLGDFGYQGHDGDRVYRITPDGSVETFVAAEGMRGLTTTAFGPDGTLYQSSFTSDIVYAIEPDGTAAVITDEIRGPTGVLAIEDGTVYVASFSLDKIYEVLPDGTVSEWSDDRQFNGLNSLTRAPDGTLYAADFRDGRIFEITPEGESTLLFEFPEDTSHVAYLEGSLFVTSRAAYVVFRYDLETADVEIIAGNGEPGDRDGRGVESSFGRPNAITVGPDGALYINHGDGDANDPVTIRRITHDP